MQLLLRTLQPQGHLLRLRNLPPAKKTSAGMLFPEGRERTYNRSFEYFAELVAKKQI
jgi:hypothetical protein